MKKSPFTQIDEISSIELAVLENLKYKFPTYKFRVSTMWAPLDPNPRGIQFYDEGIDDWTFCSWSINNGYTPIIYNEGHKNG